MTVQSFTMRASSIASLFDCAHRFEYVTLMKRGGISGMRALLGSAIHAGTASYDSGNLFSADDEEKAVGVDEACGVMMDFLQRPPFEVDYTQDDLRMPEAERLGLTLLVKYCQQIATQFEYVDVESRLAPLEIDCGGGVQIILTGQIDRGRVVADDVQKVARLVDIKTGRRSITNGQVSVKPHMAQCGAYELMYEQTQKVEVEGSQIAALSTGTKTEVGVSPLFHAKKIMIGKAESLDGPAEPGLLEYAAEMFRTGLFPPNPQSQLCGKKYCPRWNTCTFHD